MNLKESLQSTKLWKHLNKRDANLADVAIRAAETADPQLAKIAEVFPLYTRHDAEHSVNIIARMEQVVSNSAFGVGKGFSASESLILIVAAFYHDIGMSIFPWEDENEISDQAEPESLQSFLRKRHAERGLDFLMHEFEEIGLPKNLITLIHHVMRAHNMTGHDILSDQELTSAHAAGGQELSLLELISVFCIADALEFSDDRVVASEMKLRREISEFTNDAQRYSYLENQKHVSIGSSVTTNAKGVTIFSGTFDQAEVLGLAHRTIDDLEDWVRQYADISRGTHGSRVKNLTFPFIRQLSMPGVNFERLGIRIKADSIIQLISSNSTWANSPAAPIRELLQNAIEACRYRAHLSPSSANYAGRVAIDLDRSNRILRVSDNGCGMTRETILDHFLNVGHSRSENPSYRDRGLQSIARFGIGFWSVFTIADSASVETCTCERSWDEKLGISFDVSTNRILGYTVLNICEVQPGTTVKLMLKQSVDIDQLEAALGSIMVASDSSVSIHSEGSSIEIANSPQPKTREEFYGLKIARATAIGANVFHKTFTDGELSGAITIGYGQSGGRAAFKFAEYEAITLIRGQLDSFSLGVCGFPKRIQIRPALFDFTRVGVLEANTADPGGFQYTLNRNSFLENDRLEEVKWRLQSQIHSAFSDFIEAHAQSTPSEIYRLTKESSCNGGCPAASFNKDAFPWLEENFPELIAAEYFHPSEFAFVPEYQMLSDLRTIFSELVFVENTSIYRRQFVAERDFRQVFPILREVVDRVLADSNCCVSTTDALSQHLFDHTPNSMVFLPFPEQMGLAMLRVPLSVDSPFGVEDTRIEEVRGGWSGTVFFREVVSPSNEQFVFLGQHRLVVKPESPLADRFLNLRSENRLTAIAEIAQKLQISRDGSVVSDVESFL
ncbi:MAG: ATP-binding protein [Verrucomicrobiales bacterium]